MLLIYPIALVLVAVTVGMHAIGLSVLLWPIVKKFHALKESGFWLHTGLIIWLAWRLVVIHLAEIAVWGLFYYWQGFFPNAESAFYFSGVTYTTVGYGDLVLPEPWRILAPSEALIGILMCGLSTGLFFAIIHLLFVNLMKMKPSSEPKEPPVTHDR